MGRQGANDSRMREVCLEEGGGGRKAMDDEVCSIDMKCIDFEVATRIKSPREWAVDGEMAHEGEREGVHNQAFGVSCNAPCRRSGTISRYASFRRGSESAHSKPANPAV